MRIKINKYVIKLTYLEEVKQSHYRPEVAQRVPGS